MKYFPLLAFVFYLFACDKQDTPTGTEPVDPPNILLIIADDMGKDATAGFAEGSLKPFTPNLDQLQSEGLVFNNFWVNPTCSPTRAAIITGKYGYRTGVKWANDVLDPAEQTLPAYLREKTDNAYATALVGKWHLSGESGGLSPEAYGVGYYAGLMRGGVQDYYRWQLTEDGATSVQREYITEVFTELARDWVSQQTQPWFLWLAYNAPHTPFHVPPAEMHNQGALPEYTDELDPLPYYLAAIEAMDYQIGTLLDALPTEERERTVILFMGDNGTPNLVAQSPYSRTTVKGTLYQGGVNVPLIIAGKGVSRRGQDNSLITATDLFATIAELAGVNVSTIHDSQSFRSLLEGTSDQRDFQYAELNNGTDDRWAIGNATFKLIVSAAGEEELYDLSTDPYETTNLLDATLSAAAASAKASLEAELLRIRD